MIAPTTPAVRVALLTVAMLAAATPGRAQQPIGGSAVLKGFGIEERLGAPLVLLNALEAAKVSTKELPLFARLVVDRPTIAKAVADGAWDALDARIAGYQRHAVPVVLAVVADSIAAGDDGAWRSLARALATRYRGRVHGYQLELPAGSARPDAKVYAYLLRTIAVSIRAVDASARVGQATMSTSDAAWQTALFAEDTAAYVDFVAIAAGPAEPASSTDVTAALRALALKHDPTAVVLEVGVRVSGIGGPDVGRWLAFALSRLGDPNVRFTIAGDPRDIAAALTAAVALKDLFAGDLITLEPANVKLTFSADGTDVTARVPHRLLYSLSNFSTYLAYWQPPAGPAFTVSLVDTTGRTPMVRDATRRTVTPVTDFSWEPQARLSRFTAPSTPSPLVLDFNYGAVNVFGNRADAAMTMLPSASEIVFRHQQAQARQESLYRHFVASARMEQKFRAGTESFNIVSENRFFSGPDTVEWEELAFSVNGGPWGPDRPAFPLLQAEKVLSLPLDLRLTADYTYRLDGTADVAGRRCFVIVFDPIDPAQARYRGRIWIDAETYVRLRLNAIQTRLDGLVVSSEEVHSFMPATSIGDEGLYLTRRVSTTQQILIAGQNILLEKVLTFSEFDIDGPDFEARRAAARAGDRIMFRDTPEGLRYLVKSGSGRVVSDRLTMSSKALALGTAIDPSFEFPVPIAGLNYLDFSFLGGGNQLALLWGGPLVLGNIQRPQFGGLRSLDASVDFFTLAVPSTTSVFDATGERLGERVLTIPISTGANLGYQIGAFQKLRVGYQFKFDAYFDDDTTSPEFVVPASTSTHGLSIDYKFTRRGYTIGGAASTFRRVRWKPWGLPGTFDASTDRYRRHSVGASKDFFLTAFQTLRTAVSWHAGDGLDRFSMYQFGLFDEVRMHGVPAGGVRFPELVLGRVSYSFNVFDIYRLDLFFDRAAGRDPDDATVWHPVTGTGVAFSLRTPWRTMFRADIGKSFVPERYAGAGSWVIQLMLLKPL